MVKIYKNLKDKRKAKVRANIFGTEKKPRVSVFRSNKYVYVQAINDYKGHTLASGSSIKNDVADVKPLDIAIEVGKKLGETLKKLKISEIVFDRGPYKYHGKVKNIAEGLRQSGIKF